MTDIKGYEGLYAITEDGQVWSYKANKFKKPQNINGYLSVVLYKDKHLKNYSIHRLVAETFIPNPDGKPEVNHIDEDKTNNCVDNLEWCTKSENCKHGTIQARRIASRGHTQRCFL